MKKIVFTLALLCISISGFAQTNEEAAAINKWIDVYAQLYEQKDWNKMVEQAADCQKEAPSWEYLDYYLGVAYSNLGNNVNTINEMTDFISKIDTVAAAFMIRGNAYVKENDVKAALEDYNHVLKLNPKDINAMIEKANICLMQNDNEGYIANLSDVISVEPNNIDALTNRGSTYARNKQFDLAIADFTAAINAKPNAESYLNRAKANFALQTDESYLLAIADCNEAEKLGVKDADLYTLRLACNQKMKKYAEMLKDYDNLLSSDTANMNLIYGRGVTKYQMNDYKGAIADMDTIIASDPNNVKAYQVRATCKTKLKDTKGAQEDAKKVKELQGIK
ncbi:MAG: tetratricopeptide repeat protein [Bacteroidales bacterium]|jgi:tetratricopeptide (TPR) repeat protein|nr:tetratricopeptide repeat protein [Bacteroidales bacterium]